MNGRNVICPTVCRKLQCEFWSSAWFKWTVEMLSVQLSVESCGVNSDQVPADDSVGFHCTRSNKSWAPRFGLYRKQSTSNCTSPSTRFRARMVKILIWRKRNRLHHFRCCPAAVDLMFFIFCQNSRERSFELWATVYVINCSLFFLCRNDY